MVSGEALAVEEVGLPQVCLAGSSDSSVFCSGRGGRGGFRGGRGRY